MTTLASSLASSNSCGLQTLHCFLFLGLKMNYHWKLQCMYFRFHFQKNPQWKCHSSAVARQKFGGGGGGATLPSERNLGGMENF